MPAHQVRERGTVTESRLGNQDFVGRDRVPGVRGWFRIRPGAWPSP